MESTPIKSKSKKSLLMQFKPVTIDHDSILPPMSKRNASDPVLSYLAVADKDGAVLKAILPSVFDATEHQKEECRSPRRKKDKDKWQAIKEALHETTLMRRINRRKMNKKNLSLSRSTNNLEIPNCKISRRTSSTFSSSSFGSSPASTVSFSSLSLSSSPARTDHISSSRSPTPETHSSSIPSNNGIDVMKQKQCGVEHRKKGQYYVHGANTIVLHGMFSVSLLVLILWGRIPAIVFTSIWFYLLPPSRRKPCNERGFSGETEFDTVQNKNKFVMKRKLERSHTFASLASYGSMSFKSYRGTRNLKEWESFFQDKLELDI